MKGLRAWLIRLGGVFRKSRTDRELADELDAHLQAHIADNLRAGMAADDARRDALIALGGMPQAAEACRDRRTLPFVETTMLDLRHALRMLRKTPGFAAAAVLTLALGIGANTAIFSVLNAVILRPLDYPHPERLMKIVSVFPGFDEFWISSPEYLEFRQWTRAFSAVGAYQAGEANLSAPSRPQRVRMMIATDDLFTALGVGAQLGRTFEPSEIRPGGAAVAVLSHDLWDTAYGSDPSLVGRTIDVNGLSRTVVGIMPAGFDVADQRTQIWLPLVINPATANRGAHNFYMIGRLATGATVASARAEMETLLANWRSMAFNARSGNAPSITPDRLHAPGPTGHRLRLDPLQSRVVGNATTAVWVLQGAVVLVLLIACANLSTLLLSRAESRRKEFAVRSALGAARGRLMRQAIVEGCLLSTMGAALGVGIAVAGLRALVAAYPDSLPRSSGVSIDLTVLAFTVGVALLTGVVFGIAPLLHLSPDLNAATLKESGSRSATGRHTLRRGLVVAEVALAVALVVGAGLLLRTVNNLSRVDPGFNRTHLVTFGVSLPLARYQMPADRRAFYRRLTDQLGATPGVLKIATMDGLPPLRLINSNTTLREGRTPAMTGASDQVDYYQEISAGYVETMGIPVVDGRSFTLSDAEGPPTAMVNQSLARFFWPGVSPLGRSVRPCCNPSTPWFTVVGVLRDVKQGGVEKKAGTELYFSADRIAGATMNVVMRTPLEARALLPTVQRIVSSLDPSLPIIRLRAMDDVFDQAIARPRLLAQLLTVFAGLALLLATIGIYGVLSYMVNERRREIGIRMALGAPQSSVLRMIVLQGMSTTGTGLIIGLLLTVVMSRTLASLLFGVSAIDPITMAAVVALIGLTALAACYVPGFAATRVDPMIALREE